jgi:hypothetical protein
MEEDDRWGVKVSAPDLREAGVASEKERGAIFAGPGERFAARVRR